MSIEDIKASTIEEYFGTLQQSTVEAWKKHLKTDKYSNHIALNEFYEDIVELVDTLIEDYMGIYGKLDSYINNFKEDKISAVEYLELLREFTITGREDLISEDDTELSSDIDAIISLIDGTLYKLKELKESKMKSLVEYIKESLNENEESLNETEKEINEAEESIKSEEDFRDYAKNKFKTVFGDKLDEDKMKEVVDGILDEYTEDVKNNNWGKLVGVLNKSFGSN